MPGLTGLWPTLAALGLGLAIGAVFGLVRLNVPAPSTLAGIAGVAGLYLGWALASWVIGRH